MGSFLAACMAYFLNSYGIMIFLEAKDVKGGPLLSSYIFMFSLFILLWHQRVYPKSLRKLIWPSVTIIEVSKNPHLIQLGRNFRGCTVFSVSVRDGKYYNGFLVPIGNNFNAKSSKTGRLSVRSFTRSELDLR